MADINYEKIYNFLKTNANSGFPMTATRIAEGIGVERIYGGTMNKLVRDGYLVPVSSWATKDHKSYRVNLENFNKEHKNDTKKMTDTHEIMEMIENYLTETMGSDKTKWRHHKLTAEEWSEELGCDISAQKFSRMVKNTNFDKIVNKHYYGDNKTRFFYVEK